jgi:circadian clock protein KaiC
MEFLVRGAKEFDEPGVFCTFEETPAELIRSVASLGFDVQELIDAKKLSSDHIFLEPSEIKETGEYDLEGLFVRLVSSNPRRSWSATWRRSVSICNAGSKKACCTSR